MQKTYADTTAYPGELGLDSFKGENKWEDQLNQIKCLEPDFTRVVNMRQT